MKIPRRMFFFYDNPAAMPWLRLMSLWSFRKHNPEWEMVLAYNCRHGETSDLASHVGPEKIDFFRRMFTSNTDLKIVERLNMMPVNYIETPIPQMADHVRWMMLGQHGGWFADTDILWLDSMESIERECANSDLALLMPRTYSSSMSLMGAAKRGSFTQCVQLAASRVDDRRFQSAGWHAVLKVLGIDNYFPAQQEFALAATTKVLDQAITFMPSLVINPWDSSQLDRIFDQDWPVASESTIGIHWFGSSNRGHRWCEKLQESNWRIYGNTITHYLRNLIDNTND